MATFTVTVREDGTGDYTSLAAAVAGELATGGVGDILRIEITGSWTNPDTTAVDVTGLSAAECEIECTGDARHNGVWSDTAWRFQSETTLNIRHPGRYKGLQVDFVDNTSSSRSLMALRDSGGIFVDGMLVKDSSGGPGDRRGIDVNGALGTGIVVIANSIVYDCTIGYSAVTSQGDVHALNCTAVNCGTGFNDGANNEWRFVNCLAVSNTVDFDANDGLGRSSNNLSSDVSAPGDNSITSATVTFEDGASDDYRLSSSDTSGAIAGGLDLSADATYAFSTDITGVTRTGTWSIGAYQVATDTGERSVDDGLLLGDAPQGERPFTGSASDGLSLGDSPTLPTATLHPASDGISLGEAAQGARALASTASDGLLLGEDITTAFSDDSGPDGILLGDSAASDQQTARAAVDGLKVGEALLVSGSARAIDALLLGDLPERDAELSLSDSMLLGESIVLQLAYLVAPSDGLSLGDGVRYTRTTGIIYRTTKGLRFFGLNRFP